MAIHTTRIAMVALVACTAALACAGARAGTVIGHCVSTAQQLQNALTASSDGGQYNGLDNRIKIVAGLYQTRLVQNPGPGTFFYVNTAGSGDLWVEGGYNSDCSARSPNPLTTLIDGNSQYQVMLLESKTGSIKVSGVTLENGETTHFGGGLAINDSQIYHGSVTVFDTIIRDNHSTGYGGGMYANSSDPNTLITIRDTLIVGNSVDEGESAADLVGNGAGVRFYDNTVTGNSVPGSQSQNSVRIVSLSDSATCDVINNIIDHNANGGLWVDCVGGGSLWYNDVGHITNAAGLDQLGNVSVDPHFVDEDGGDYHLSSASTLFGFTPMWIDDGVDLDGNPRQQAGLQDIGAYEDTVFASHFDSINGSDAD